MVLARVIYIERISISNENVKYFILRLHQLLLFRVLGSLITSLSTDIWINNKNKLTIPRILREKQQPEMACFSTKSFFSSGYFYPRISFQLRSTRNCWLPNKFMYEYVPQKSKNYFPATKINVEFKQ